MSLPGFYCPSSGYTISGSAVCNGYSDCPYGEDEMNCNNVNQNGVASSNQNIWELTDANFDQAVSMGKTREKM